MEQGRREEAMKQQQQDHHHRRLKPPEQPENQPQQPQKCPRCDSLNTKFCYYNNYSLSQPRYFCKACRRYWTQGGTLRNVPVGGGCRKGKRSKAASSSGGENSRSHQPPPPPPPPPQPPHELQMPQNLSTNYASRNKELGNLAANPMNSYYSGDGFLSSLPNQPLNLGGSSNMALLQGFNMPSFSSQQAQNQQIQQQNEFYQMGNRNQSLIQPNRPFGSWNIQSHIKNSTDISNPTASDPSFWTNSGNSLNPNPWPDLPGYGHPQ